MRPKEFIFFRGDGDMHTLANRHLGLLAHQKCRAEEGMKIIQPF